MSLMPIQGYSPNRQDYIDDPDTFNFRVPTFRPTRPRPMMTEMRARLPIGGVSPAPRLQPFQPQPAPPQFNQQGMQQMMQMMQSEVLHMI